MLTDLRKVNACIEPMGSLQPGLSLPTMILANWHILIIDLNDYFFSIPLLPNDCFKFAFTIPATSNQMSAQSSSTRYVK